MRWLLTLVTALALLGLSTRHDPDAVCGTPAAAFEPVDKTCRSKEGTWNKPRLEWVPPYSENIEDRRGDYNVYDEQRIPADWVRAKEGKYLKKENELVPYEPVPPSRGWQR